MSKQKKYNEVKVKETIYKFNSLSEEDQKAVVKILLHTKIGFPYITNRFYNKITEMGLDFDEEELQSEQAKASRKVLGAIDTLVDKVVYGDDKELTDRVINKFVLEFKKDVRTEEKQLKKERNEGN